MSSRVQHAALAAPVARAAYSHPVVVRVEDEGNVAHLAVGGALLEVDAERVEALLGLGDVVDGDGQVAKAWTTNAECQ